MRVVRHKAATDATRPPGTTVNNTASGTTVIDGQRSASPPASQQQFRTQTAVDAAIPKPTAAIPIPRVTKEPGAGRNPYS